MGGKNKHKTIAIYSDLLEEQDTFGDKSVYSLIKSRLFIV